MFDSSSISKAQRMSGLWFVLKLRSEWLVGYMATPCGDVLEVKMGSGSPTL